MLLRSSMLRRGPTAAIRTPALVAARRLLSSAVEYASSCYLPTEWTALPLVARREVSADSTIYDFGLPEKQSLNLPVCACLLLKAPGAGMEGSDAVRPYTPISDNSMVGRFELLVKRYEGGAASQYLQSLPLGSPVEFKHIKFNIKEQYPFPGKTSFTLIAAGTGITPMYQALGKLLNTAGDDRKVTVLYGSRTPEDILLKEELDLMAKAHPDRLQLVHVVGTSPDELAAPGWTSTPTYTAETGWIDEAKIRRYAFGPSEDTLVFVCGLPSMYDALCGPRNEKELAEGTALKALGYTAEMVAKM